MGTKDFFDLFKLNILKNSWLYFLLICWLTLFAYLPIITEFLPLATLEVLARVQENLPRDDSWLIPVGVIKFVFWILAFLLFKEIYDRFKDYMKRGNLYRFFSESWNKDWIYNGKSKLLPNSAILRINSSRAGCLYAKQLWKNFKMKFLVRFFPEKPFRYNYDRKLGLIFRARDLENYFMLQISYSESSREYRAIPHVRYQGMWEIMSDEYIGSGDNLDWLTIKLIVNNRKVRLTIGSIGSFKWTLPTHVDINHIEDGIKKNGNNLPQDTSDGNFGAKVTSLPQIDFKDSFGMIGFRAYLNEGADIKNLKVVTC